jgi:hypothetical protein
LKDFDRINRRELLEILGNDDVPQQNKNVHFIYIYNVNLTSVKSENKQGEK